MGGRGKAGWGRGTRVSELFLQFFFVWGEGVGGGGVAGAGGSEFF